MQSALAVAGGYGNLYRVFGPSFTRSFAIRKGGQNFINIPNRYGDTVLISTTIGKLRNFAAVLGESLRKMLTVGRRPTCSLHRYGFVEGEGGGYIPVGPFGDRKLNSRLMQLIINVADGDNDISLIACRVGVVHRFGAVLGESFNKMLTVGRRPTCGLHGYRLVEGEGYLHRLFGASFCGVGNLWLVNGGILFRFSRLSCCCCYVKIIAVYPVATCMGSYYRFTNNGAVGRTKLSDLLC